MSIIVIKHLFFDVNMCSKEEEEMTLRIKSEKLLKKLLAMPESGMGYQVVDIILKNGQILNQFVVLSCEYVILPSGYENIKEEDITEIQMPIKTEIQTLVKSWTLVGRKVLEDKRDKNSIKLRFDDGSALEARRSSGPDANHMGWSDTVTVFLNGEKILEGDA